MATGGTGTKAIRRVLLCLALGGVMTVAVAWGCALLKWEMLGLRHSEASFEGGPYYERYRPAQWPELDDLRVEEGIGVTHRSAWGTWRPTQKPDALELPGIPILVSPSISEDLFGWPWRSLGRMDSWVFLGDIGWTDPKSPTRHPPKFSMIAQGFDVPGWFPERFRDRVLPLRPIWPGFLFSALLYGSLAWLVLFVPGALRRRVRRRRGLCLRCKYPLGDFAVCPECGGRT